MCVCVCVCVWCSTLFNADIILDGKTYKVAIDTGSDITWVCCRFYCETEPTTIMVIKLNFFFLKIFSQLTLCTYVCCHHPPIWKKQMKLSFELGNHMKYDEILGNAIWSGLSYRYNKTFVVFLFFWCGWCHVIGTQWTIHRNNWKVCTVWDEYPRI